jgi:hypothetical protein
MKKVAYILAAALVLWFAFAALQASKSVESAQSKRAAAIDAALGN